MKNDDIIRVGSPIPSVVSEEANNEHLESHISGLLQCDGNDSFLSNDSDAGTFNGHSIDVVINISNNPQAKVDAPTWYEAYIPRPSSLPKTRKTVRRDNKLLISQFLPSFSVTNIRSIRSKINSYSEDFIENELSVGLIQEIWEKPEDTVLYEEIEKIFETKGLNYISNPRHPYKRGGGVAFVTDTSKVNIEKLDVTIPHNL